MPAAPTAESSSAPATGQFAVFSKSQRWYIVALNAGAGWFSTLSSFIYYPVLSILAEDLQTSIARINFTVTSYLAISGVAPSIAGDASEMFGRRPVYLVTLSLYFCANVGIALQKSFVALLLLRMLQSAGISGTFSVAYGVIADIATPAERGAFVGALSFGITTAPSFGPLLGGVLAYRAAIVLVLIVLTLPETARSVVGNGSNAPSKWSRPLIPNVMRPWKKESPEPSTIIYKKKGFPNPLKTLVVLSRLDTAVSITAGSILYMIFCASHASLSTTLIYIYNLNDIEAGLIYLPYGASCLVSTLMSGKFPIEEARMRSIFVPTFLATFSMIGYGWAVHYHAHLSIPMILQFLTGLGIQTCFNYNNTLLVDINHEAPATAQASFNLVRCIMAALATGVIQYMIDGIGFGWSFTIFGGSAAISALLYFVEMKRGMRWRVGNRKEDAEQVAPP
ncbi:major facilitator superfamily transporter [Mytilinidion resinicola]|uniref:Major facilitator superfamily transporter n=1 Tax=Mytilinidion resinicola TaxID=574789 RepID=A0A6A6Y195_9PEZI|nr:major facilitator superfamily transporter [Mytilinidion resinicola]KAF2802420.1 major facilitator superfamily transporter [Mytilinidion resinicola]